ncbi:MAG TPA: hypothetical protein ENN23_01465 [Deltaproteobacteria bacterium]|nr:hypothetical protein [Deltaproteobacteria bacterium]
MICEKNIGDVMKIIQQRVNVFLCGIIFLSFALSANLWAEENKTQKIGGQALCPVIILKNEELFPAFIRAIDEARDEILICVFSFRAGVHERSYPDRIVGHLSRAVKRGVKVTVILENSGRGNNGLGAQNLKTKNVLEEKGVVVYLDSPRKTTHTKLVLIDQRIIILGSHNFTQSAMKYNNEISLLLERPDLAREIREYMMMIIEEAK